MSTTSSNESLSSDLKAHYEIETFTYYPTPNELCVSIKSATTTVGSNIVDDSVGDLTGLKVWPATHLMCQHIVSHKVGQRILELGCGSGLLGVAAALAARTDPSIGAALWVSTDMDETVLNMCRENYRLNGISIDGDESEIRVRKLQWGSREDMDQLLQELESSAQDKFDAVVGADIIYPATCGQVLTDLFETVNFLLMDGGTFWLSFATRDGHRTPQHLLEAASAAGFSICSSVPPLDPSIASKLPPLLDAKILILKRCEDARLCNASLGSGGCTIFPGLKSAISKAEESSSEEEWDGPPLDSDD